MSNAGCILAAVNERTLLIVAALGASVVAYAVYGLMTRAVQSPQPVPVAGHDTPEAEPAKPKTRKPKSKAQPQRTGRVNAPVQTRPSKPTGGPPPAVPMPKVSVEEARENYDDLMAELERELQRNKDTGKPLANEHWVEYYRRGHEVMDPLRRLLGFGDDAAKKEIAEKDEALRELMADLQADPATL